VSTAPTCQGCSTWQAQVERLTAELKGIVAVADDRLRRTVTPGMLTVPTLWYAEAMQGVAYWRRVAVATRLYRRAEEMLAFERLRAELFPPGAGPELMARMQDNVAQARQTLDALMSMAGLPIAEDQPGKGGQ
jgi:hypothetical protein